MKGTDQVEESTNSTVFKKHGQQKWTAEISVALDEQTVHEGTSEQDQTANRTETAGRTSRFPGRTNDGGPDIGPEIGHRRDMGVWPA